MKTPPSIQFVSENRVTRTAKRGCGCATQIFYETFRDVSVRSLLSGVICSHALSSVENCFCEANAQLRMEKQEELVASRGGKRLSAEFVLVLLCLALFAADRLLVVYLGGGGGGGGGGGAEVLNDLLTGFVQDVSVATLLYALFIVIRLPFFSAYWAIWESCVISRTAGLTRHSIVRILLPILLITEILLMAIVAVGLMSVVVAETMYLILFQERFPTGVIQHVFRTPLVDMVEIVVANSSGAAVVGGFFALFSVVALFATLLLLQPLSDWLELPNATVFDSRSNLASRLRNWNADSNELSLCNQNFYLLPVQQSKGSIAVKRIARAVCVALGFVLLSLGSVNFAVLVTSLRDFEALKNPGGVSTDNFYFFDQLVSALTSSSIVPQWGTMSTNSTNELLAVLGMLGINSKQELFTLQGDHRGTDVARITHRYVGRTMFNTRRRFAARIKNDSGSGKEQIPAGRIRNDSGSGKELLAAAAGKGARMPHIINMMFEGVRRDDIDAVTDDGKFLLMPNVAELKKRGVYWNNMYSINFHTGSSFPYYYCGYRGVVQKEMSYVYMLARDYEYHTVFMTDAKDGTHQSHGFDQTIIANAYSEWNGALSNFTTSEFESRLKQYPSRPLYFELRPEGTHPPFGMSSHFPEAIEGAKGIKEAISQIRFPVKQPGALGSVKTRYMVDMYLGQVVAKLQKLDKKRQDRDERRILLMVSSDHGFGLHKGKQVPEDEQFRIPFLIADLWNDTSDSGGVLDPRHWGRVFDEGFSSNADIWPTMFDLLKIEEFTHWGCGRSLMRPPPPNPHSVSIFPPHRMVRLYDEANRLLKFDFRDDSRRQADVKICDLTNDPAEEKCTSGQLTKDGLEAMKFSDSWYRFCEAKQRWLTEEDPAFPSEEEDV